MLRRLPEWAVTWPKLTVALAIAATMVFAAWLPRMRTDTDPKNMLPVTSDVRVFNRQVEQWFGLHEDMTVVGIVRDGGLFDRAALEVVSRLTDRIVRLPGVVAADVTSVTTADNVVAEAGTLSVQPLLPAISLWRGRALGRVPSRAGQRDWPVPVDVCDLRARLSSEHGVSP